MKVKLVACFLFLCAAFTTRAQYVFITPTHYHGVFADQLSSARAQGMGYTTITLDGIGTAIYNPATISPGKTTVDLAVNYAKGNPTHPFSYYPFVGVSFKPVKRLTVGASMFAWIDPDSYWTATIQNQDIDTDKKTQHMYSVMAAYEVINGLHVGVSGNFLRDEAVRDYTTNKEFILGVGAIYDRPVNLISDKKFTNQKLRIAASLINATMNAVTEQTYQNLLNYRDLPIILRGGLAYGFSIPLSAKFTKNKKFFAQSPELLDLTLRLQYQDWLKHKEHNFKEAESSSAFGIGAEAWFMKLLALRMGYYAEDRGVESSSGTVVTEPKKKGFTWGLGANVPVQRLTNGKVPVDVEVNLVTQRMMNELKDQYFTGNSEIRDRRFQFCIGLNVKWNRK